ncbi:MAG: glycerol-3-phosphate dehydrogenase, partial [Clostridia bacterium]|nr:glycerol-3-phosphate dehydrogenase [Clostridia bacterium]
MVVEGINALPAAMSLARKYGVEMPITETAYEVVFNGKNPKDAVLSLMTRDKKAEAENIAV